jgi:ATP synthase protein I
MKSEHRGVGSIGTLGIEIVLCVLFGFFGGRWLDGRFDTAPWLSGLGFLFGCGAAAKAIHRAMKEMQAVTEREERRRGNPPPLFESDRDRKASREGSHDAPAAPISPGEHDERKP